MLKINDQSLLIVNIKESSDITISVPHHTPGGTPYIPCPEHRDGDENAGFIGRHIADALDCSFICASNYFIDPNKRNTTELL